MSTPTPPDGTITVLVADDERLVRTGLRAVLAGELDLRVVGEAADGAEAVALAAELRPDVVLMDVRMPGTDGIEATARLTAGGDGPKVLVVTTFENDDHVYEALRAGASGFLLKRARAEEMVQAVRLVARGESLLFPDALRELALLGAGSRTPTAPLPRLTEREGEVLRLIAEGLTNGEIAERLVVSVETTKSHVGSVLAKLGVRDRTQAVIAAYESGFVRPGSR
ncbi:LuxR family transcriptional regulator [Kitasatospora sp. MMS16-BH015]|uniref:response regulator transcription factor n=1 Tax=Kitasatospora sp. MMS16-BH015 TaxID=2018025 RepID=UPI000CA0D148|nr:response regulator transcription factor [Kitasatospora sp. MMS16-BH015]AUG76420.1 LuxR family transcriptional regulator [Kitasatospora sp. MMS16-BH015]